MCGVDWICRSGLERQRCLEKDSDALHALRGCSYNIAGCLLILLNTAPSTENRANTSHGMTPHLASRRYSRTISSRSCRRYGARAITRGVGYISANATHVSLGIDRRLDRCLEYMHARSDRTSLTRQRRHLDTTTRFAATRGARGAAAHGEPGASRRASRRRAGRATFHFASI